MSNEVKIENAKPGMWAEFDIIENKKDIKTGHYLLELQSVPVKSVEDLMYLVLADALHGGRIIYSLGVDLDDGMIPIIDGEHEPMPYVENLHVYEEKPESASSGTDASDDDPGDGGDSVERYPGLEESEGSVVLQHSDLYVDRYSVRSDGNSGWVPACFHSSFDGANVLPVRF